MPMSFIGATRGSVEQVANASFPTIPVNNAIAMEVFVQKLSLVWSENEGYENHKADRTELGEPTAPAPPFARPLPAR